MAGSSSRPSKSVENRHDYLTTPKILVFANAQTDCGPLAAALGRCSWPLSLAAVLVHGFYRFNDSLSAASERSPGVTRMAGKTIARAQGVLRIPA